MVGSVAAVARDERPGRIDVHEWRTTQPCIDALKRAGFRIAVCACICACGVMRRQVSDCAAGARPIGELDCGAAPTAFVFGNEVNGVSAEVCRQCSHAQSASARRQCCIVHANGVVSAV